MTTRIAIIGMASAGMAGLARVLLSEMRKPVVVVEPGNEGDDQVLPGDAATIADAALTYQFKVPPECQMIPVCHQIMKTGADWKERRRGPTGIRAAKRAKKRRK